MRLDKEKILGLQNAAELLKERPDDLRRLKLVGSIADELGVECYVVGGYVRDLLLDIDNCDYDFVVVGRGIDVAKLLADKTGGKLSIYESYGTASVMVTEKETGEQVEFEFVGARKEFYHRESRNPIVEDGTLEDDINRRDLTINAMAITVTSVAFGDIIDLHGGKKDLMSGIIRTVGVPEDRFNEDPLRIMRAARFAAKLGFDIEPATLKAMKSLGHRLDIITRERITEEVNKILLSRRPSIGFTKLQECGVLDYAVPGLEALTIQHYAEFTSHKNIFYHTMVVLDNMAEHNPTLANLWAALLHDIAKPACCAYDYDEHKWTFYMHEHYGAEMAEAICTQCMLSKADIKHIKKLIEFHMVPAQLSDENVSDKAIRRFMYLAGDEVDDIILLSDCDMSTAHPEKIARYLENNMRLRLRIRTIEMQDSLAKFKLAIDGNDISERCHIPMGRMIGKIKSYLEGIVVDGDVPNSRDVLLGLLDTYHDGSINGVQLEQ